MPTTPPARSVKIPSDERGGWSSDRPRPGGGPPRPVDVSVRCRVLSPSDRLRYNPGSMVVIVSPVTGEGERFAQRVVEDRSSVLSLAKVRTLLAGRVEEDQVEERAAQILDGAVAKRLEAGESVVLLADGLDPQERERHVRVAHRLRRPRHLLLLEAGRDQVADEDRPALNDLRRAVDTGDVGAEGFQTALRLGGGTAAEVKKILFRPAPQED